MKDTTASNTYNSKIKVVDYPKNIRIVGKHYRLGRLPCGEPDPDLLTSSEKRGLSERLRK